MAEFVLKNNYFQFSDKVYQQILGTVIDSKFAPPYACILWIKWEVRSYKLQSFNLLYGLGTLTIFSLTIVSSGLIVKSLTLFVMDFNNFNPNIKITYEFSEASISFLDLIVKLKPPCM